MTDALFDAEDDAATPITPDERAQLIPTYITTRDELNEAEQQNIADADRWAFTRRRLVLDADFLKRLHKRMLGDVWRWAGQFRTTERNIGIEAYRIETELHALLDDVRFWIEHATFPADEIAVRFHHRLVAIHPFPNGNGRHARLAADLLVVQLGGERFRWGRGNLVAIDQLRRSYITALKAADAHDIGPLLAFARS
ncbi:mobile mystery protein B [Brevundimonas sp.]|uniref:mobile mystery protein B n=1 Tax=Brevundimonas sp. TaxID=1871086 RepID=UPI00262F8476|nr:mobile mystery protein B [Brevundimonas sp.]